MESQWSQVSVLSQIARDVFAVPVSRVATEAIFNTEECVLDSFRSSLSPKIVEALICCQDWLRMDPNSITVEELSSSYSDYLIKVIYHFYSLVFCCFQSTFLCPHIDR